jgi:DNA-directed RNA polymerase subunit RPC12/RpoP
MNNMAKQYRTTCIKCGSEFRFENDGTENDKVTTTCPECGADISVSLAGVDDGSWLPCLPFEGPENKLLAGILIMRSGPATYVTFDGRHLTRKQAIEEVGESEVKYWERKRSYTPRPEDL